MNTCTPYRPPPSPDRRTTYMRPLPADFAALDSRDGRELFTEALLQGTMEGYFKLAQQFHTQSERCVEGLERSGYLSGREKPKFQLKRRAAPAQGDGRFGACPHEFRR